MKLYGYKHSNGKYSHKRNPSSEIEPLIF